MAFIFRDFIIALVEIINNANDALIKLYNLEQAMNNATIATAVPITAIAVVIHHFQSIGLRRFGFSARNNLPSEVRRAASTPPPSTYAPLTKPSLSSERTQPLKMLSDMVSGCKPPDATNRSTLFSSLLNLILSMSHQQAGC